MKLLRKQGMAVVPPLVLEELFAVIRSENQIDFVEPPGRSELVDKGDESTVEVSDPSGVARLPRPDVPRLGFAGPSNTFQVVRDRLELFFGQLVVAAQARAILQCFEILFRRIVGTVNVHEV